MSDANTLSWPAALRYLYSLPSPRKWRLERMRGLVDKAGLDRQAFKAVHVAGSNGKGSVSAMLESCLRSAGFKTGLYTSPHLVDFTERIKVNGKPIPKKRLAGLVEWSKPFVRASKASFFEASTLLAFKAFQEARVEWAVVEAGMGGRLDATNVLSPEVTVITNAELEHRRHLGDTISKIAREKAGVVKRGVPVVTGCAGEALRVVRKACKRENAALRLAKKPRKVVCTLAGTYFEWAGRRWNTSLLGAFQAENACIALTALRELGVAEKACAKGLASVDWPGRLQVVGLKPLVAVDGAHNPSGVKALVESVHLVFRGKRVLLVVGVLKDKDFQEMLEGLAGLKPRLVFAAAPDSERALPAKALARAALRKGLNAAPVEGVKKAVAAARKAAKQNEVVLVTGSLYTVGEALRFLG